MRTTALLAALGFSLGAPAQQVTLSDNVVVVIAEGLRPQEIFSGADPVLMAPGAGASSGIERLAASRAAFWSEDPDVRRLKLMPFFWTELGRRGMVLGNRTLDSRVSVGNAERSAESGYAEILSGATPERMRAVETGSGLRRTLLEFVLDELHLEGPGVAAFASSEKFCPIATRSEDSVFCNGGYRSRRRDAVTVELALEHLERFEPRFLVVSLSEMDAWAAERRYDESLMAIHRFDDALRRLWEVAQSRETYRDRTTLLVTTTHGRGRNAQDWTSNGAEIEGSEETWIAIMGPDTPARREDRGGRPHHQSNVAATILELFELDYQKFNPIADPPIPGAIREP